MDEDVEDMITPHLKPADGVIQVEAQNNHWANSWIKKEFEIFPVSRTQGFQDLVHVIVLESMVQRIAVGHSN